MTDSTTLPLVCTETLSSLADSLDGGTASTRSFVCRFIEMWPGRFQRIHEAVAAKHADDAMDAALSLRSSSIMVGAAQLGELASDLVRMLGSGPGSVSSRQLQILEQCGNSTTRQLAASYINVDQSAS